MSKSGNMTTEEMSENWESIRFIWTKQTVHRDHYRDKSSGSQYHTQYLVISTLSDENRQSGIVSNLLSFVMFLSWS